MGTAAPFTNGATSAATFSVAAAPLLFFVTSDKSKKYSAAAANPNELLPKLFSFTFPHVTALSLYSPFVFTLLLLPRYFSLVEHTRLPL